MMDNHARMRAATRSIRKGDMKKSEKEPTAAFAHYRRALSLAEAVNITTIQANKLMVTIL